MRGHWKVGLAGLSLLTLTAVFGRAAVGVAFEKSPPPAVPLSTVPDIQPQDVAESGLAEPSDEGFGFPPMPVEPPPVPAEPSERDPNTFESQHPPFAEDVADANPFAAVHSPYQEPLLLTRDQLRAKEERARNEDLRGRRDRLTALASEVASLASEDELDSLIAELETTVAEKRAAAELRDARAALARVVAAFPQTAAADAARDMLGDEPAKAKLVPVEAPR